MGAGASAGEGKYNITDEEMEVILSSARGAVTEATGGRIGTEVRGGWGWGGGKWMNEQTYDAIANT